MNTENNGHDNGRLKNGRFAPGNRGRQPGTTRNRMREAIKVFLSERWPEFGEWFNQLKPSEKVRAYMELLPFGVSKLQTVAFEDSSETVDADNFDFNKLSDEDLRTLAEIQKRARL